MHRSDAHEGCWRLPAKELEGAVIQTVGNFLGDELRIIDALRLGDAAPDRLRTLLARAKAAASELEGEQPERHREVLHLVLHRLMLHADSIRIELKRGGLAALVDRNDSLSQPTSKGPIELTVPALLKRRGVEAKLILCAPHSQHAARDGNLIALLARVHLWFDQIAAGQIGSVGEIAHRDGIDASDVGRHMQLAFLAPDIVEAILAGRQPVELTARRLKRIGTLPLAWNRQRRLLGFPV